jgi:hypothetical protein
MFNIKCTNLRAQEFAIVCPIIHNFSWIVDLLPLQVEVVVYTYLCMYGVMNLIW